MQTSTTRPPRVTGAPRPVWKSKHTACSSSNRRQLLDGVRFPHRARDAVRRVEGAPAVVGRVVDEDGRRRPRFAWPGRRSRRRRRPRRRRGRRAARTRARRRERRERGAQRGRMRVFCRQARGGRRGERAGRARAAQSSSSAAPASRRSRTGASVALHRASREGPRARVGLRSGRRRARRAAEGRQGRRIVAGGSKALHQNVRGVGFGHRGSRQHLRRSAATTSPRARHLSNRGPRRDARGGPLAVRRRARARRPRRASRPRGPRRRPPCDTQAAMAPVRRLRARRARRAPPRASAPFASPANAARQHPTEEGRGVEQGAPPVLTSAQPARRPRGRRMDVPCWIKPWKAAASQACPAKARASS